jgi:hypothetical protein
MKNLILILLLSLASCQSIYKTTITYTTDSLGNKIKTIKKEYRENTSDSYIEINTYPEYGYPFGRPYYSPFYSPFYRPYYRPYYRPNYGPHYTPRPTPRNEYYPRPSISGPRTQIHQAPIRNFPKVDHRR